MRMASVFLVIVAVTMVAPLSHGLPDDQSPKAVENWLKHFPNAKPKLTKLHFYLHDIVNRNPPASAVVAKANTTDSTPATSFGLVTVLDAPLTETPDGAVIGYSQGLNTFCGQEERSGLVTVNFVFTTGKYNGSTLSLFGRNPVAKKYREFSIIGGSDYFRLAHGIGISSFYLHDARGDMLELSFVFYRYVLPGQPDFDLD